MLALIDVWDVQTFDRELLNELRSKTDLVRDYTDVEREQFLQRQSSDHRGPHQINPHGRTYQDFRDFVIMPMMNDRTIRAWHYSRMTDAEVNDLARNGIHTSDLSSLQRRLDAQVAGGNLSVEMATDLYAKSPLHDEEFGGRSGKFWMTALPLETTYGGIVPLLES